MIADFGKKDKGVDDQANIVVSEEKEKPNVGAAEYPNQNNGPAILKEQRPIKPDDLVADCQIDSSRNCEEGLGAHFPEQTPEAYHYLAGGNQERHYCWQDQGYYLMLNMSIRNLCFPPHC